MQFFLHFTLTLSNIPFAPEIIFTSPYSAQGLLSGSSTQAFRQAIASICMRSLSSALSHRARRHYCAEVIYVFSPLYTQSRCPRPTIQSSKPHDQQFFQILHPRLGLSHPDNRPKICPQPFHHKRIDPLSLARLCLKLPHFRKLSLPHK